MIIKNLNIVTVVDLPSEKWCFVRIRIVKENGFIQIAFCRKTYPKNGIVWIAKNNGRI